MQFSALSLSRVLLNVDRDTLREAIALADLWDLFSHTERQILNDLGGWMNYFENLATFSKPLLARKIEEVLDNYEEFLKKPPFSVTTAFFFRMFRATLEKIIDIDFNVGVLLEERVTPIPTIEKMISDLTLLETKREELRDSILTIAGTTTANAIVYRDFIVPLLSFFEKTIEELQLDLIFLKTL